MVERGDFNCNYYLMLNFSPSIDTQDLCFFVVFFFLNNAEFVLGDV